MENRNGIIVAGNWIVDHIKTIDVYPEQDALANIEKEFFSNGGAPFNVAKDIAKLGASFPIKAVGVIGNDANGEWIKNDCRENGIDTSGLIITDKAPTSYTDVMSVKSTGRRTFFHQRGANALLDIEHFDFTNCTEKIFHLGYLLLLDKLDEIENNGKTRAATVLEAAQKNGLKTSVDIVSENSNRFNRIVTPALPYVNYLFINEFEASRTTGIELKGDFPELEKLKEAATKLINAGVNDIVFIHFPFGVYALNSEGKEFLQGAVKFPKEKIKSVVGAGDALAAGILFALHNNWEIEEIIKLGVSVAAASLQHLSCSGGVINYKECLMFEEKYGFKVL